MKIFLFFLYFPLRLIRLKLNTRVKDLLISEITDSLFSRDKISLGL